YEHSLVLLEYPQEVEDILLAEFGADVAYHQESSGKFMLTFEQHDWLNLTQQQQDLIANLNAYPGLQVLCRIIEDEPSMDYVRRYRNKDIE
ncbi:MAG: hypothetical protein JXR56_03135, partial [Candidatus Cloacimonetes bacterium]|nr:hypothetical protein [Candidatus Cloacimonadota bacterium]